MAAGTSFSMFLSEEGEVFGCGDNNDGKLGLGEDYVFVDSEDEEEEEDREKDKEESEKV